MQEPQKTDFKPKWTTELSPEDEEILSGWAGSCLPDPDDWITPQQERRMQQWEYHTEALTLHLPEQRTRLNEMGRDGWELVTGTLAPYQTSGLAHGQTIPVFLAVFKRPVPREPVEYNNQRMADDKRLAAALAALKAQREVTDGEGR